MARLSHWEWGETIRELFGVEGLSISLASDPLNGKAFDNNQAVLRVGPSLWRDYQIAAETLAERVTSDPTLLARLAPVDASRTADESATAFIETFGLRVFRRPLLASEVTARRALFAQGQALYPELDPFVAGVRLCLESFLQSPYFIYRIETHEASDDSGKGGVSDWQIASRLSYAIWHSMPDQELYRAAEAGELSAAGGMHHQIERMLDGPRTAASVERFFEQLYDADQYPHIQKSQAKYPDFSPEVARDMHVEFRKFTDNVYQLGGGLRELLTSTTTFVTPRLAAIYGLDTATLPAPDADGFSRFELDAAQRSGLLTLSGFLAWKGTDSQPNTIQRGVFVTRRILCQPLGNPPPEAQSATFGSQTTNRSRIEALTGPGTCGAGCHGQYINPAGFAFEHFGALGEYRTDDEGSPIDASATFEFEEGPASYIGASQFSQLLGGSLQAHACFSSYLLEYVRGREGGPEDAAVVENLAHRSLGGASIRELLAEAVVNATTGAELTAGVEQ
ncbi:MAG TPA: DUF1592 domain-containing protein [Polyangiaceae bacterium]|nr:DUF1592 domain-containing protein [Polyangiaceae bacterium]